METEVLNNHTANKGEWSEIYTFFKLLVDKSLTAADENLELVPNKSFSVLKIVRDEKEAGQTVSRTYDLTADKNEAVITNGDGVRVAVVNLDELRSGVKRVFAAIKEGEGRSFPVPEADSFMRSLMCSSVKAASSEKSDIRLVLQDRFAHEEMESGFSIKTAYQSAPTLLNASKKNTNFIYEVIQNKPEPEVPLVAKDRVRDRVISIYQQGDLRFVKVESDTFRRNLELVESIFPRILAAMLAHYHRGDASTVADLVRLLPNDLEFVESGRPEEFYKHKVKQFLEAIALGMTPAKKWDGEVTTNGGFIVVKNDGELACYHLYDREKFLEYLYTHTKFDTPSTTRHEYGSIEKNEDGKNIIRLNLQIRFI